MGTQGCLTIIRDDDHFQSCRTRIAFGSGLIMDIFFAFMFEAHDTAFQHVEPNPVVLNMLPASSLP